MNADDELAIHRVLALYGLVVDDGATERLDEVFTDDAVLEPTLTGPFRGLEEIRGYYRDFVPGQPIPTIGHYTIGSVVDFDAGGGSARVRSKGIGIREDMGYVLSEYRDVVVKAEHGWRIQHRQIIRRTRFSTDPV